MPRAVRLRSTQHDGTLRIQDLLSTIAMSDMVRRGACHMGRGSIDTEHLSTSVFRDLSLAGQADVIRAGTRLQNVGKGRIA